ncbi:unnamed protein product [Larinioides sclopetarius]|uniref:Secreted protein n=1 Tax=Larinioides sclopetarius TaxID=280406 RepID=A0AAV2AJH6_9ARAC
MNLVFVDTFFTTSSASCETLALEQNASSVAANDSDPCCNRDLKCCETVQRLLQISFLIVVNKEFVVRANG